MALTDDFDLGRLGLSAGEARRLDLVVQAGSLMLAGERYALGPAHLPATLDVARLTGRGYSLRLRLHARVLGPCMRCLQEAAPGVEVDAREVEQPGEGEELDSPYVRDEVLDLRGWAHDAIALTLPAQVLCQPECAGLCGVCGENLNDEGRDHLHPRSPDPRWAKLSELQLE